MTSPDKESLSALLERLGRLIGALESQNKMLMVLVDMNQQMLDELIGSDDPEDPRVDLAGRPLKL